MPPLRWIATPVASAAFAAIFAFDIYLIRDDFGAGDHSTCLSTGEAQTWPASCVGSGDLFIKTKDGIQYHVDVTRWGEVFSSVSGEAGSITYFEASPARRGFWAITRIEQPFRLRIAMGSAFTPADIAAARAHVTDWIFASGFAQIPADVAWRLRLADTSASRPIPSGYVHNAVSVASLSALLVSLMWVPRYARSHRAALRTARGLCPRCSYNLHGLREPTCPECGTPLSNLTEPRPSGSAIQ